MLRGKVGRKGRNLVHRFLSCHIQMSPQRVVGALSCLTTSSMISAFGVPHMPPPVCVFLTLQDNTCPISLTTVMLSTQQQAELARLMLLQSLLFLGLVLYSVLWFPLPLRVSSAIDFTFLDQFVRVSFPFPASPALGAHSSAPPRHCHRRPHADERVIPFLLQRVSLIKSMPPFPATSAPEEIEAFCQT